MSLIKQMTQILIKYSQKVPVKDSLQITDDQLTNPKSSESSSRRSTEDQRSRNSTESVQINGFDSPVNDEGYITEGRYKR